MNQKQCFLSLSKHTIIDFVREDGRSQIFGQTLEEMRQRYPDAQIMGLAEAVDTIESTMIDAEPKEITEEQFFNALEVLPPKNWRSDESNNESFMMIEHLYGSVTSVYARLGKRYFAFHDRCTLTHEGIVRKVAMSQAKNQAAA